MKYLLIILVFFALLGAHQATQTPDQKFAKAPSKPPSKAIIIAQANEHTEANKIKAKLAEVRNAMLEKRLLHELWMLTRHNKDGGHPLRLHLYIAVKDKNGQPIHINRRKQGHLAYITLSAYERSKPRKLKWEIKIKHCLVDMDNLSELMYE